MKDVSTDNRFWQGVAKMVAHDMGTPLSALMGWMELLPTMKKPETALEEVRTALERLTQLSNRLTYLTPPLSFHKIDLYQISSSATNTIRKRLGSNKEKIQISNSVPINLIVNGNEVLIEWAIEQLLKNAIDALPELNGSIFISGEATDSEAKLIVSDTGHGIPSENRSKLFDPGFTTKNKGRGVGLPLVKYIMENLHQGSVELSTAETPYTTSAAIIFRQNG